MNPTWNPQQVEFVVREFTDMWNRGSGPKLQNVESFSYQPNASIVRPNGDYVSFYYNTDHSEWRVEYGNPEYCIEVTPVTPLQFGEVLLGIKNAIRFQFGDETNP